MKKCPFCNHENENDAKYCSSCGANISCVVVDDSQKEESTQNASAQTNTQYNYAQGNANYYPGDPRAKYGEFAYRMKWYKFLIYFALFAGAFYYVISAITLLAGNEVIKFYIDESALDIQFIYAKDIFGEYPWYKVVTYIAGVIYIVVAGAFIYSRVELARMKRIGWKVYLISTIVMNVLNIVVTSLKCSLILNDTTSIVSSVIGLVIGCAIIWAQYIYFRNRNSIFH